MKKIPCLILLIFGALLFSACDNSPSPPPEHSADELTRFNSFHLEFFDTLTVITGYAKSQEAFGYFRDIILEELERVHILFDIHNAYPDINNLHTINQNAGIAPVEVAPDILELLQISKEAYRLTDGAVNIALGPVLSIWHTHRSAEISKLPDMELLHEANEFTNIQDIIINEESVFLQYEHMSLDMGGIAKGFAAERAAERAIEAGFVSFIINLGGDVRVANPPPGRDFWNVGVTDPTAGTTATAEVIEASNTAVFPSGDYQRYFIVDEVAYNHIIDPKTLMPATQFRSVTVIYPCAIRADILSTAIFIMDLNRGKELLAQNGAKGLWITSDGQIFKTWE